MWTIYLRVDAQLWLLHETRSEVNRKRSHLNELPVNHESACWKMEMRSRIGSNSARIWCDAKFSLNASYESDDTAKVDDGNVFSDGST